MLLRGAMPLQVRPEQVLHVRNLLLRAGTNLWQPLDFDANEVCGDDEVKAALEQMLGAGNKQEVRREGGCRVGGEAGVGDRGGIYAR